MVVTPHQPFIKRFGIEKAATVDLGKKCAVSQLVGVEAFFDLARMQGGFSLGQRLGLFLTAALYLGGNSSGPSGASKIWNSKYYTSAVSFGDDPSTFTSIVDGSNAAPNVVAASGWLWIAMRSNDGIRFASLSVNGSNSGDFQTFGITGLRASTNYESGAWDDPFPGNHTSSYSSVMQAYVTYTASASGIPKIMQAHARRRR